MKQSGLGQRLLVGGYDLSGDTQSWEGGPVTDLIEVTGIDKSAKERIGGQRDGSLKWTSYFNPSAGAAHPVLSALPTTDVQLSLLMGTGLGVPAMAIVAKQPNYAGKRDSSGKLTFDLECQANAYAMEFGVQLTPGVRADTTATNGTGVDQAAASTYGAQAYLHVTGVTGTSVTVKVQDSADDSSWADVTGLTFTAATGVWSERLATSNSATIRRYVRAVSTGTFTAASFVVVLARNDVAGVVF